MVPMHAETKRKGALHEPWLVWSSAFRRLEPLGPAEAGTPSCQRLHGPYAGHKTVKAVRDTRTSHGQECASNFRAAWHGCLCARTRDGNRRGNDGEANRV